MPLCVALLFFAEWVHIELVQPYEILPEKDDKILYNLFRAIAIVGAGILQSKLSHLRESKYTDLKLIEL